MFPVAMGGAVPRTAVPTVMNFKGFATFVFVGWFALVSTPKGEGTFSDPIEAKEGERWMSFAYIGS